MQAIGVLLSYTAPYNPLTCKTKVLYCVGQRRNPMAYEKPSFVQSVEGVGEEGGPRPIIRMTLSSGPSYVISS